MARWDVRIGSTVVDRIEAPDKATAEAQAVRRFGPSARVKSVASEEVRTREDKRREAA